MRKFIQTIQNIWKIEDLRSRLLTTLLFVLIYRFGSFVVLPGIDPTALSALHAQTAGGLMALLDMFSGGAFSNASIFALGIMPYISASIVSSTRLSTSALCKRLQRLKDWRKSVSSNCKRLVLSTKLSWGRSLAMAL